MNTLGEALRGALGLMASGDATLGGIVALSLAVSLSAVLLATLAGPAAGRGDRGRALSRAARADRAAERADGPAAGGGRPARLPAAVARRPAGRAGAAVHAAGDGHRADHAGAADHRGALPPGRSKTPGSNTRNSCARWARTALRAALTLVWDIRFSLVTAVLAGFGRALAEVGAVIIVGGNIDGVTRVMTTTIALETSQGRPAARAVRSASS